MGGLKTPVNPRIYSCLHSRLSLETLAKTRWTTFKTRLNPGKPYYKNILKTPENPMKTPSKQSHGKQLQIK